LTAGDAVLPEGVTLITSPEEVVVTIAQAQLAEVEEEAVEAEEPAEEAAPEAGEPEEEAPSEE
jgi:large subunit ribosomal protein L25